MMPKLIAFCASIIGFLLTSTCQGQQSIDAASLKQQVQAVYDKVRPAIVRFGYGDERPMRFGCGVIVSDEGHIAVSGPVQAIRDDALLQLTLADGRRVTGKALGWSGEFRVGLLQITEPGPWPHVEMREAVKAGELCVSLAYPREDQEESSRLTAFTGVVTQSQVGQWLTTSQQFISGTYGVFDLQGRLLGTNCEVYFGDDHLQASSGLIKAHWNDLIAGKNLDRTRLNPQSQPPNPADDTDPVPHPAKVSIPADVIKRAKAASVRISELGEEKGLVSGVIATADGLVMTCGHHSRLPGHELTLTLRDGRRVPGVLLANNRLADIGLIKITEDGPWPHAELGQSATVEEGKPCLLIGYPTARPASDPWIYQSHIIHPTQTLRSRDDLSYTFWTFGFPDCRGASGGGVFDQQGNVIGVLLGGALMQKEEDGEMNHARVELFQELRTRLDSTPAVEVADATFLSEMRPICEQVDRELSEDN